MTNTKNIFLVVVVALIAIGGWLYLSPGSYDFQFAEGESITEWNFQGAYTGNAELEARAQTEITRLEDMYGNPENDPTDYIVHISIANQHNLLGNGEKEYEYLMKALAIDSEGTGLAWHNLGKLLERLGAYKSALTAYDAAVAAQPTIQYQTARLEFLRVRMPEAVDLIAEAEQRLNISSDPILE